MQRRIEWWQGVQLDHQLYTPQYFVLKVQTNDQYEKKRCGTIVEKSGERNAV